MSKTETMLGVIAIIIVIFGAPTCAAVTHFGRIEKAQTEDMVMPMQFSRTGIFFVTNEGRFSHGVTSNGVGTVSKSEATCTIPDKYVDVIKEAVELNLPLFVTSTNYVWLAPWLSHSDCIITNVKEVDL